MKYILSAAFLLLCLQSFALRCWTFVLHGGIPANLPLPLTIMQKGFPDIYIKKARYYTEPFKLPYYWDWRLSKWIGRHAIELEAIHHKLYLKNQHTDIQQFGISHGFNIITLNYARQLRYFVWRNGAGSILSHPENTVRNRVFFESRGYGYLLRGIVYNTAVAKSITFAKQRLYINTEVKATFAKASVPIANGKAIVNNIALHGIVGIGVNFARANRRETK